MKWGIDREGSSIGESNLSEMQGRPAPRRGPGDLREPAPQAASRL